MKLKTLFFYNDHPLFGGNKISCSDPYVKSIEEDHKNKEFIITIRIPLKEVSGLSSYKTVIKESKV